MTQPTLFSSGELQRCLLCGIEYEPAQETHACEIESDWTGCYKDSWKGLITPDAFAHPAKFSRGLIHRIYAHARDEGWLVPGSTVVDPFGGVALGGLEAAWHGAHWVGCELEQKFVDLGRANIALWQTRFGHMSTWGSVRLVQGDSRQLSSVLEKAGLCVSSPVYLDARQGWQTNNEGSENVRYGATDGNLCNLPATDTGLHIAISSPPYAESLASGGKDHKGVVPPHDTTGHVFLEYGSTDGQLGAMRDHGPSLVVGSPPFADVTQANDPKYQEKGEGHGARHGDYGTSAGQLGAMVVSSPPFAESLASDDPAKRGGLYRDPKRAKDKTLTATYGTSEGQLGAMKDARMVVSSPPYEGALANNGKHGIVTPNRDYTRKASNAGATAYGHAEGQTGVLTGSDFWTAARAIVEQTYQVLAPNSHAIWVLKGFICKKQYVDFPDQWRQLCEACGFITLHWHRAWLVEPGDVQAGMLGGSDVDYTRERKSFFRLLTERKGSPRIDFEVVLCMLKP